MEKKKKKRNDFKQSTSRIKPEEQYEKLLGKYGGDRKELIGKSWLLPTGQVIQPDNARGNGGKYAWHDNWVKGIGCHDCIKIRADTTTDNDPNGDLANLHISDVYEILSEEQLDMVVKHIKKWNLDSDDIQIDGSANSEVDKQIKDALSTNFDRDRSEFAQRISQRNKMGEAFQEQDHPRDRDGKFTGKGGSDVSYKQVTPKNKEVTHVVNVNGYDIDIHEDEEYYGDVQLDAEINIIDDFFNKNDLWENVSYNGTGDVVGDVEFGKLHPMADALTRSAEKYIGIVDEPDGSCYLTKNGDWVGGIGIKGYDEDHRPQMDNAFTGAGIKLTRDPNDRFSKESPVNSSEQMIAGMKMAGMIRISARGDLGLDLYTPLTRMQRNTISDYIIEHGLTSDNIIIDTNNTGIKERNILRQIINESVKQKTKAKEEFQEHEHPRDRDGKFTGKGSGFSEAVKTMNSMFEKHDGFSIDNYINSQGEETKKRMLNVIERDESVFNKFLKSETEREENKWNMPSPVVSHNKETNDYKRSGQSKEHEELFGFTQNIQKGEIKFVSMTPDKYLSLVPKDFEHGDLDESKLESIREGFKKGNWMKTPFLVVDVKNKKIRTHEGRHRAWIAKELGIKEMPVAYFTDNYDFEELDDETKQDITNGNLKREYYGEAFQEEEHPRDRDGKFAKKGSSKSPKELKDNYGLSSISDRESLSVEDRNTANQLITKIIDLVKESSPYLDDYIVHDNLNNFDGVQKVFFDAEKHGIISKLIDDRSNPDPTKWKWIPPIFLQEKGNIDKPFDRKLISLDGQNPSFETLAIKNEVVITMMSPLEFLKLSEPQLARNPEKRNFDVRGTDRSIKVIDTIKKRMLEGKPVDTCYIKADNDTMNVWGHEGRHRALSAIQAGIELMPVYVMGRFSDENKERIISDPLKYLIPDKKADEAFVEDEHPRDEDGKFADKGGSAGKKDTDISRSLSTRMGRGSMDMGSHRIIEQYNKDNPDSQVKIPQIVNDLWEPMTEYNSMDAVDDFNEKHKEWKSWLDDNPQVKKVFDDMQVEVEEYNRILDDKFKNAKSFFRGSGIGEFEWIFMDGVMEESDKYSFQSLSMREPSEVGFDSGVVIEYDADFIKDLGGVKTEYTTDIVPIMDFDTEEFMDKGEDIESADSKVNSLFADEQEVRLDNGNTQMESLNEKSINAVTFNFGKLSLDKFLDRYLVNVQGDQQVRLQQLIRNLKDRNGRSPDSWLDQHWDEVVGIVKQVGEQYENTWIKDVEFKYKFKDDGLFSKQIIESFQEDDHPRDRDGKFTDKDGGVPKQYKSFIDPDGDPLEHGLGSMMTPEQLKSSSTKNIDNMNHHQDEIKRTVGWMVEEPEYIEGTGMSGYDIKHAMTETLDPHKIAFDLDSDFQHSPDELKQMWIKLGEENQDIAGRFVELERNVIRGNETTKQLFEKSPSFFRGTDIHELDDMLEDGIIGSTKYRHEDYDYEDSPEYNLPRIYDFTAVTPHKKITERYGDGVVIEFDGDGVRKHGTPMTYDYFWRDFGARTETEKGGMHPKYMDHHEVRMPREIPLSDIKIKKIYLTADYWDNDNGTVEDYAEKLSKYAEVEIIND